MTPSLQLKPRTAPSAWRTLPINRFLMGAPHYPEHVDDSYLERDAKRMVDCGFNVIRMAEFAWNLMEPREGVYDFSLFERTMDVFGAHGISTILCTPTATPPRWLTHRYPEVLRVDGSGRSARHGSRQQADTCSPVYRAHSRRITGVMAEHFKGHRHLIGWQTDNELNTTVSESFSDSTAREFRLYLEQRYKTIAELNGAWGTNFWAQTYDHFDQVDLPFQLAPSFANPTQVLDYHRFLAHATAMFQRDQVEILRGVDPSWFLFHNVGQIRDMDFRGPFAQDLDFLGFDVYPLLKDEYERAGSIGHGQALYSDIMRGHAGNFIVPEQQSGLGSQPGFATIVPEEGEMMRMAMSSVARGADGILFFRWRPAHFGAEIYWNGILDHDDVERRRYAEAKRFGLAMQRIGKEVLDTVVRMDVGIASSSFDNQEAHRSYPLGLPEGQMAAAVLHRYCYDKGVACGFVHPEDDLSRLKVFFVPHWVIWTEDWTAHVEAFVRAGGTLIVGARTATRNEDNHVIRTTPPGSGLAQLCGVHVEEFGLLPPPGGKGLASQMIRAQGVVQLPNRPSESSRREHFIRMGDHRVQASYCYELLTPLGDTEVIARWDARFTAKTPAITARKLGRGRVIYVGTYFTPELSDVLMPNVLSQADVGPLVSDLPAGVEVSLREGQGRRLLFLQNTTFESATVPAVPAGSELLGETKHVGGEVQLGPYGCAVIQLK